MGNLWESTKSVARILTPPIVWDGMRHFRDIVVPRGDLEPVQGEASGEKDAHWYDDNIPVAMQQHYSRTHYYCFWTVIVDRMLRAGIHSVLDIGCGTGQFAALLRDKGFTRYLGFDFSQERIQVAKSLCSGYQFAVANALDTEVYDSFEYEAVACLEFLEHIHDDLGVISRIRPGVAFYGSVPDFSSASHVRHFASQEEVSERYSRFFRDFRVDAFPVGGGGNTFYLFEGVRRRYPGSVLTHTAPLV